MDANRRRCLKVPFAGIVFLESLVGKNAGRANFDQIAAEFIFEDALFGPSEI